MIEYKRVLSNIGLKYSEFYILEHQELNAQTKIIIVSSYDLKLIKEYTIKEEMYLNFILNNVGFFRHFNSPNHYYSIDFNTDQVTKVESLILPIFKWKNGAFLNFDVKIKSYICFEKSGINSFTFKWEFPICYKWSLAGIIQYQNDKKNNNWIKCINPGDGKELWQMEFEWNICRLESFENLIILDYQTYDKIRQDEGFEGKVDWYHPNYHTIVIDADTGKVVWQTEIGYFKIDSETGVLLFGGGTIKEVEISTGKVLTEITNTIYKEQGFLPFFVDIESVYYLTHKHSFGKISKKTGLQIWEFDLVDENGEKRMLADWFLLGNGNLVLQTMPNHPNGDFTYIFNPSENMEYASVINGVRVKEILKK